MPDTTVKVEHTSGPWQVIAGEFKDDGIVAYEIRMPEAILSKSNADLIAAAPDMLEALMAARAHVEELRDAWQSGCISEHDGQGGTRSNRNIDVAKVISQAIAKAEGQ
jgi:hypothetical protein